VKRYGVEMMPEVFPVDKNSQNPHKNQGRMGSDGQLACFRLVVEIKPLKPKWDEDYK